jgi:hypothetical protein
MGLTWQRGTDYMTRQPTIEIRADRECQNCGRETTLAHTGFEVVAKTLAEPLRQMFKRHLDEHGCAETYGFAYCPEAMRLFNLLPDGDRVVVG